MKRIIFIKYGELNTKKGNINFFINQLYSNICLKLKNEEVEIKKTKARIYIETKEENFKIIIDKLKQVFGIHSIVLAYQIESDFKKIKEGTFLIFKDLKIKTFKVETRRIDKGFSYSSLETSRLLGSFILKNNNQLKVDVHHPEFLFKVEIRKDYTYLYQDEIKGLGGFPVGSLGKGLLMLSGGIDSPVAGFLAIKKGIKIEGIYFDSPPHTSIEALNKVKDLAKKLMVYNNEEFILHIVPFTKLQETIYQKTNPSYMITILRRMMYLITEKLTLLRQANAFITGESIGQVASQTLTSLRTINNVTKIPIIRPLACLDKAEIVSLAKKIDTYKISILPYEDCCTIFVPKHPIINPTIEKCLKNEEKFDYQKLIKECLDNVQTLTINTLDKNEYEDLL
ncbi:MAG: tRNA uracil 4-sulfurtransferase ThiI [Bacilli bacterium]|jgi:thiamine biosynthesis protein ThiI